MPSAAVHIRFAGLFSSARAEALARSCISGLDAMYGDVRRWEVCLQPPLAPWCSSGYAVRARAHLEDGSLVSIQAHGLDLEATVRDAFEGIEELLLQETRASDAPRRGWLPTVGPDTLSFSA